MDYTHLHPILVHFPIALLSLYSLFELIRFGFIMEKPYWFYIKATFLTIGTLGAMAAALVAPRIANNSLVSMHRAFAELTICLFLIPALAYALEWLMPTNKYSKFVFKSYVIVPLALIGFALITITGGLGGAIVYGTQFDPMMAPVFKLLKVY